ncbi:nicotinamide N-methyltransferase-like, partial [Stegostoma tigrinum]|uniref:nicotinamide N-methyltransferase-like n=1 Tax=Stegostoma tigrinum TaxID=3053191 RepID=UPI0028704BF4
LGPKLQTLLEIGCGPTLHCALCATEYVEEIVLSDFASSNRKEIELWIQNDPGDFDWSLIAKRVCELEGNSLGPKLQTLLEIGCGPTLHCALCATEYVEEIVLSDFASSNRKEIELWIQNDPGDFDWSLIAKRVCELEGNRGKWMEKEKKLRDSIKQVLKCDVHQSNPLHPVQLEPVDCILTASCLEAACKDEAAYRTAVRNITSLLKPGGVLIIIGDMNQAVYKVNEYNFSILPLDRTLMKNALEEADCEIKQLETCKSVTWSGNDMIFFLVAQKK